MECRQYKFSSHAIKRMFERKIEKESVIFVVKNGEIIAGYPNDKPYPSYLILAFVKNRPLHVLTALDKIEKMCYIITVYEPDIKLWHDDYKTRTT